MKKKFVYIFSALAILLLCVIVVINILDYYDKKSRIDYLYNLAKSVPTTNPPCEAYYRYTKLLKAEERYETNFYTQIAKDALEIYRPRCGFRFRDIQTFMNEYIDVPAYRARENLFLICDSQTAEITKKTIIRNTDPQITLSDVFERLMPEDSELLKNRTPYKVFIRLSKEVGDERFKKYQYVIVGENYEPRSSGYYHHTKSGDLWVGENLSTYEMSRSGLHGGDVEINRETLSLLSSHTGSAPVKFRGSNYERKVAMDISTKCTIDTEADENWLTNINEITNGIMEEKRLKDLKQKKEQEMLELQERLKREKEAKEKNII